MRTTVTLDADTEAALRARMAERGISFKQALNDAIRAGLLMHSSREPFTTQTASMGTPVVDLDRALSIAADLEDEELILKMRRGA
jgi:hypothetical protein